MLKITPYSAQHKDEWDTFVSRSKNGTFLFCRDYMEYHSDRFEDYSLMIHSKGKLMALLPANATEQTLYSHQGLTYGGLIVANTMKTALMLAIFDALIMHLKKEHFFKFIYKTVPAIYHSYPAEEDCYALFRNGAKLYRRDISSTIYLNEKISFSTLRKRKIKIAKKHHLKVEETQDARELYPILLTNLNEQHKTRPAHSQKELEFLKSRFPEQIKFFLSKTTDYQALAGIVVYEMKHTIHTQYICSTPLGRRIGALDILLEHLINTLYKHKRYFDFGISTENKGLHLNEGLVGQKEMFGGRGICYDSYRVDL